MSTQQLSGLNNQNVYMTGIDSYSNEDRSGGSSMGNLAINRSFNITGSQTAQKSSVLSSGAVSKSSQMGQNLEESAESANYNDSAAIMSQNGGFVSAGRRQRPLN